MSMNYTSYTLRLANFITTNPDNIDYAPLIPATIDYAEQRIYRELNLLSTRVANSSSDRKSTRLNSSHSQQSRMPSSA
mgnify:CR=1 FL=1